MYNPNAGYGRALLDAVQAVVPTFGRVMIVVDPDDSDEENYQRLQDVFKEDSQGFVRFYTDLATAYAAMESNNNDVLLLDGNSTHALTAVLNVAKNRCHFIGMDGGDRLVQQGSKIEISGATDVAYVMKDTGVRNSFRNIKFIQSSTHANALAVAQLGSEGALYKNVTFTFGVVDNLDQTTAHEVVAGTDSATFLDCNFGTETLLTSAARSVFHIDQVTASQEFKSNILRGCTFLISSSSSTATFIRLDAVGDVLFTNLFDRCNFIASVDSAGGIALAEAVQTGTSTVKGVLCFSHPAAFNVTDFSTATGGRNAAVQLVGVVTTAGTGGVGVQPTA